MGNTHAEHYALDAGRLDALLHLPRTLSTQDWYGMVEDSIRFTTAALERKLKANPQVPDFQRVQLLQRHADDERAMLRDAVDSQGDVNVQGEYARAVVSAVAWRCNADYLAEWDILHDVTADVPVARHLPPGGDAIWNSLLGVWGYRAKETLPWWLSEAYPRGDHHVALTAVTPLVQVVNAVDSSTVWTAFQTACKEYGWEDLSRFDRVLAFTRDAAQQRRFLLAVETSH
ncbi:MAG: hypothetical protein HY904_26005 [Deltaproteobacteria bacterium]|nr:hypothetical protein [Deltaproteobacteria bacterium]